MPGQVRWQSALASAHLASAHLLISQVQDEMASYYEERSEAWQDSEAGETFVARQEGVEAVLSQLDELLV
jgi:hypothetical protein